MSRNPLRAWLEKQPREVTMASIARYLNVDPSYVSDMMREASTVLPSLTIAVAIERRTKGKVKPHQIYDFAVSNREKEAA